MGLVLSCFPSRRGGDDKFSFGSGKNGEMKVEGIFFFFFNTLDVFLFWGGVSLFAGGKKKKKKGYDLFF